MRLTDDELRDVLARAEEIQHASPSEDDMRAELDAVIGAVRGPVRSLPTTRPGSA